MKKFIIILFVLTSLSSQAQNTKIIVLKQFLTDIIKLDGIKLNKQQPIISINKIAKSEAGKVIEIDSENIGKALLEAKNYKHCLISVDDHTLIRVVSFKDSSPSGAWRAAMPLCKGYIQKSGVLYEKKGYLKNLIGRPDSQIRTMYLFN
jgi:hypothetical protein